MHRTGDGDQRIPPYEHQGPAAAKNSPENTSHPQLMQKEKP